MTTISPKTIYDFLDSRVVGQEHAKRTLASVGFLHITKTLYWKKNFGETKPIRSSNALIMGPSGCGKTYLVQNLAEHLGAEYLEINARSLSNEGYKGNSLADQFENFYFSKPANKRKYLLHSIVFIDEFDKICGDYGNAAGWNLSLQHSLLKALEGSKIQFPDKKGHISTEGMLFILGGNFQSIRDIVRNPKSIGFKKAEKPKDFDIHQELIKAGVIQEIAGRISLTTEVEELSRSDLKKALTEAEMSIYSRYQEMYEDIYDKELKLSSYHINKILDICYRKKIGARGLQSSLDEHLAKTLFNEEIDIDDFLDDFLNRD